MRCACMLAQAIGCITREGDVIFWLLLGGTKSTQQRDIEKAISMAVAMKDWSYD